MTELTHFPSLWLFTISAVINSTLGGVRLAPFLYFSLLLSQIKVIAEHTVVLNPSLHTRSAIF